MYCLKSKENEVKHGSEYIVKEGQKGHLGPNGNGGNIYRDRRAPHNKAPSKLNKSSNLDFIFSFSSSTNFKFRLIVSQEGFL